MSFDILPDPHEPERAPNATAIMLRYRAMQIRDKTTNLRKIEDGKVRLRSHGVLLTRGVRGNPRAWCAIEKAQDRSIMIRYAAQLSAGLDVKERAALFTVDGQSFIAEKMNSRHNKLIHDEEPYVAEAYLRHYGHPLTVVDGAWWDTFLGQLEESLPQPQDRHATLGASVLSALTRVLHK